LLANFKLPQLLQNLRTSIIGRKKVKCVLNITENISAIKELVEAGKIITVIDKRFPLEQAAEAHSYIEKGLKKGSVVLTIDHN
ncbi:MAG: zinc-binding dehydrogenase, partial [Candidatus Heimdallarchaeota archaeon]